MMMAEEEDTSRYALGFRFNPFDQELITGYLKPMILGKRLPCNIIQFRQVYGPSSHPWLVFDPHSWLTSPDIKPTEKYMYVFAKLSKLSNNTTSKNTSKNTSKRAGCGTWVGRTKRERITDGKGNVIGDKRYLVFEIKELDPAGVVFDLGKIGTYRMHEYSLSGINKGLDSADSIVLCKITHDSSKACQITKIAGNVSRSSKFSGIVSRSSSQEESNNHLEGSSSQVEKKEESNHHHLEGTASVTQENLIDGSVGNWSVATQFNNGDHELDYFCWDSFVDVGSEGFCLEDLGDPELCFDVDSLMRYPDSDQGPVEDNSVLGKRKYEEEGNSYCTKKMCI